MIVFLDWLFALLCTVVECYALQYITQQYSMMHCVISILYLLELFSIWWCTDPQGALCNGNILMMSRGGGMHWQMVAFWSYIYRLCCTAVSSHCHCATVWQYLRWKYSYITDALAMEAKLLFISLFGLNLGYRQKTMDEQGWARC